MPKSDGDIDNGEMDEVEKELEEFKRCDLPSCKALVKGEIIKKRVKISKMRTNVQRILVMTQ